VKAFHFLLDPGKITAARLHHNENFDGLIDLSLPPELRFYTRDNIDASNQPLRKKQIPNPSRFFHGAARNKYCDEFIFHKCGQSAEAFGLLTGVGEGG